MPISLIVTDLDGTLLDSAKQFSPKLFSVIRELRKQGVRFAPASGRPYVTLWSMFQPIAEDLIYISENGAMVCDGKKMLSFEQMPLQEVQRAIQIARNAQDVHPILCCADGAYYENDVDTIFLENMASYYKIHTFVPDLLEIAAQKPVCKVALFCHGHAEDRMLPLYQVMQNTLQVALSGIDWVDLMCPGVNKGFAFHNLCNQLGVSTKDCMAFGDYLNDLEMLRLAGESYAVANAHPDLQATARYICPSNDENGVLRTICSVFHLTESCELNYPSPEGNRLL